MKKKLFYILLTLTLLSILYVVSNFLPSVYLTKTSIIIDAETEVVFNEMLDLKKWKHWSYWILEGEEDVQLLYEGNLVGNGAIMRWKNAKSSNGKLQIVEVWYPNQLGYVLQLEDGKKKTSGHFDLEEKNNSTIVSWTNKGFVGNEPFPKFKAFIFSYFEKSKFKKSLKDLKKYIEKR